MARADMESAHGAPIATSGKHEAAGRVNGVNPCGCDPISHDGRSVSAQAVDGNNGNSNCQGRLIHGGAPVAPSVAKGATRWVSRVHRAGLTPQSRTPCVRVSCSVVRWAHQRRCRRANRRSRCAPACWPSRTRPCCDCCAPRPR